MKKTMLVFVMLVVVSVLILSTETLAQKVCFQKTCLGMSWEEYIKTNKSDDPSYSIVDLKKDCKENADEITDPYKYPQFKDLSKAEFESRWKSQFDKCLNARIGVPDCDFGQIKILFTDEKLSKISIEVRNDRIDSVIEAVHEKWGKPHQRKVSTYQNPFGVKADGWIEMWMIGNNAITLSKVPIRFNEIYYKYELKTKQQLDKDIESLPKKPKL
jgi:hypothetical protein